MFLQVSVILSTRGVCMVAPRGACMVAPRGHAWLLLGGCVWLLPGGHVWLLGGHAWLLGGWGVHAWLLWGGMHGCSGGACMVAPGGGMRGCSGGMCGCSGGMHGCSRGVRAWFFGGCVFFSGGMCGFLGGVHGFFDEIRSMSGRYASYWNAFLLFMWCKKENKIRVHFNSRQSGISKGKHFLKNPAKRTELVSHVSYVPWIPEYHGRPWNFMRLLPEKGILIRNGSQFGF